MIYYLLKKGCYDPKVFIDLLNWWITSETTDIVPQLVFFFAVFNFYFILGVFFYRVYMCSVQYVENWTFLESE